MLLKNKVALVTGAGQGIGRQIALTFQAQGAEAVILNDIDAGRLETVAGEIRKAGGVAFPVRTDVTQIEDVRAMAKQVLGKFGRLDVLVNNAGSGVFQNFIDSEPASWDAHIRLNLYGVIHVTHSFLGSMLERKYGRIVSIVSEAGRLGEAGLAVYSAAKAGVVGFSKAVAREVGRAGITVNCVAAGTTVTPLTEPFLSALNDDQKKAMLKLYPLRKLGQPQDVANGVLYLASDLASHVTGQTVGVSGGFAMP